MTLHGNPTVLGWATVVVYLLSGALCWRCRQQAAHIFGPSLAEQHRLIWGALALGMLGLGINKQLDLQSWLTAVLRQIAIRQNWYAAGQTAQIILFVCATLLTIGLLLWLGYYLAPVWRHYWLLLVGLLFLLRFILVRVASFWGIPLPPLSQFTGGVRLNWLLELLGGLLIGAAAWGNLRRREDKTAVLPPHYIHDSMSQR